MNAHLDVLASWKDPAPAYSPHTCTCTLPRHALHRSDWWLVLRLGSWGEFGVHSLELRHIAQKSGK